MPLRTSLPSLALSKLRSRRGWYWLPSEVSNTAAAAILALVLVSWLSCVGGGYFAECLDTA